MNKLTVTRGGGGGRAGRKGKGQVKEHVQRTHGQRQWSRDCLWEQGLDGAGDSNGVGVGEWGLL